MTTHSAINFDYKNETYTAHLSHIKDPDGTPHTEIDAIIHDDTGVEIEDDRIFEYFFDHHCPE